MPTAVKMQREFEGELNTVFVESQGHTMAQVQNLALQRKWFGTSAMWTRERPVITGARGIPNFVLLSPAGEVVLMGNPIRMHGEIEEYLASVKKQRSKAPADLPKPLHKAWKALQKGKFADAEKEARKVAEGNDAPAAQAATRFMAHVNATAAAVVARHERAIESGVFAASKKALGKLVKDLGSLTAAEAANELLAKFDGDEFEAELKAEKALAKLEKKLFANGADDKTPKLLQRFVDKNAGTKAGARARGYLDAVTGE